MTATFTVPLTSGTARSVTAQRWTPANNSPSIHGDSRGPVVVLAHGAGSRLDHPLHQAVCEAVAAEGCTVVAFNFPYADAGRRAPDRMPVLQACYRDVIALLRTEMPGRRLVIGGRSMGGRVASLIAADGTEVDGLVLLNYPVVAAGSRPDAPPRTGHWPQLAGPILFVQGTRDRLFDRAIFDASRHLLGAADVTVVDIADADHSFAVLRRSHLSREQVYAQVARAISQWLAAAVPATSERIS